MANIQIPNLGQVLSLQGSDLIEVVQLGTSKKATMAQLYAFVATGGTGGVLPVTAGGTGTSNLTKNGILYGNDGDPVGMVPAGATGQILIASTLSPPSWSDSPSLTGSLTVPYIYGGNAAGSTLSLQSTSGVGSADAILFKTGPVGAERMRVDTAGGVGIGTATLTGYDLRISKAITGAATSYGVSVDGTIQSDVGSAAYGFNSALGTAIASFTLPAIGHYKATQGTFGAGSSVTNQYGFHTDTNLIGATANYGFYAGDLSAITTGKTAYGFYSNVNTATGGGTAWAYLGAGTAPSAFAGKVRIGSTVAPSATLDVTGTLAVSGGISGPAIITATSANAFAVGQNGTTNPAFNVDTSTASSATGINIKSAAPGAGAALSAISSATNENLTVDAKGSGTITLGGTSTGNISLARNTTVTGTLTANTSAVNALAVLPTGGANYAFAVNTSAASAATGLTIISAAAGGTVALSALSSATDENMSINAKGAGTITLGFVSTGNIALNRNTTVAGTATVTSSSASALTVGRQGATNPALTVDASTASSVTGISIKAAAAAGGAAIAVTSSGTNENLTVDAKGSGAITLGGTSTGDLFTPRNLNIGVTSSPASISPFYVLGAAALTNPVANIVSQSTSPSLTPVLRVDGGANNGNLAVFTANNTGGSGPVQVAVTNRSNGNGAGAVFIAANDQNADANGYPSFSGPYLEMGVNSSGTLGGDFFGLPNGAYILSEGNSVQTQSLTLGTNASNAPLYIAFAANSAWSIGGAGQFAFNQSISGPTAGTTASVTTAGGVLASVTCAVGNPGVVTWTGNTLVANQAIYFTAASFPGGLYATTVYFVKSILVAGSTFTVSQYVGGDAIQFTSTGTSVQAATAPIVTFTVPNSYAQNTEVYVTGYSTVGFNTKDAPNNFDPYIVISSTGTAFTAGVPGTLTGSAVGSGSFTAVTPAIYGQNGLSTIISGGTNKTPFWGTIDNLFGYTTTALTASTLTLTNTSTYIQYITGTTGNVQLPLTSTLSAGAGTSFHIANNATGNMLVYAGAGLTNLVATLIPGTTIHITALNATGGGLATDWDYGYTDFGGITGTGNAVLSASPTLTGVVTASGIAATAGAGFANLVLQTTGTGATYTLPAALQQTGMRFKVTVIGGGGGGGGNTAVSGQSGGGGGSGAVGIIYLTYVAGQNTITYTVGTAGAAGGSGTSGTSGTASSITYNALTYTAGPGLLGTANGAGGAGGTVSGTAFTISINGQAGGAGGLQAATQNTINAGASAPMGFGIGGPAASAAVGIAATGYGAGGGGGASGTTATARTGGAGAPGLVMIEY